MACEQFRVIADYLNIDQNDREWAMYPEARRRRNAAGAHGRRQHQNFPGLPRATSHRARSDQRRHAFRALAFDGRNRGAGDVDELEMRAGAFALRRRERRRGCDPTKLSRQELEAVSRRYMQEMIPFVGPHTDIMGPDMGTNEQVMAWFMDTYSVYRVMP